MPETELENREADPRPALAVGHVELYVRNVRQTGEFLSRLGARQILVREEMAARRLCTELGIEISSLKADPIHSWFHITEPSGSRLTIMSSHAGTRSV